MTDARDIRMTDLRGRARFAQETRSDSGHLRDLSVYNFKRDDGIQNRIARAISYRHRAGAELDRKAVRADFHFKVIVLQRSKRQSSARFRFVRFLTAAQKTKSNETTKASTILRKWSSADCARAYGWVAFHTGKCERLI
jgi:hypothetical protein